jgi:hypothetical protein
MSSIIKPSSFWSSWITPPYRLIILSCMGSLITNNNRFWIGRLDVLTLVYSNNQLQQLTINDCLRLAPFLTGLNWLFFFLIWGEPNIRHNVLPFFCYSVFLCSCFPAWMCLPNRWPAMNYSGLLSRKPYVSEPLASNGIFGLSGIMSQYTSWLRAPFMHLLYS